MVWVGGGFPDSSGGKESTCNAGDPGLIPGSGRRELVWRDWGKGPPWPLNMPREACVCTEKLLEKEIVTCTPPEARKPAPRAYLGTLFPLGHGSGSCEGWRLGGQTPVLLEPGCRGQAAPGPMSLLTTRKGPFSWHLVSACACLALGRWRCITPGLHSCQPCHWSGRHMCISWFLFNLMLEAVAHGVLWGTRRWDRATPQDTLLLSLGLKFWRASFLVMWPREKHLTSSVWAAPALK